MWEDYFITKKKSPSVNKVDSFHWLRLMSYIFSQKLHASLKGCLLLLGHPVGCFHIVISKFANNKILILDMLRTILSLYKYFFRSVFLPRWKDKLGENMQRLQNWNTLYLRIVAAECWAASNLSASLQLRSGTETISFPTTRTSFPKTY